MRCDSDDEVRAKQAGKERWQKSKAVGETVVIPQDSSENAYFAARYCICGHLDYTHYLGTGRCKTREDDCHCQVFHLRPITQAESGIPSQDVPDHSQASLPESSESSSAQVALAREIHDWIFSPPDSWPIKGEPSIVQIAAIISRHFPVVQGKEAERERKAIAAFIWEHYPNAPNMAEILTFMESRGGYSAVVQDPAAISALVKTARNVDGFLKVTPLRLNIDDAMTFSMLRDSLRAALAPFEKGNKP